MPSASILEQKKAVVAELTEKIKGSVSGVVVCYQGITVGDDTALRVALRKANVEYHVYKNSISTRACEGAGYPGLNGYFEGMTALAISADDAVAPAKIIKEYADKIDSFTIKGGFVDGDVLTAAQVEELASIPPKPILVGKLMGSMMSPLYSLARVLQANIDKQNGGAETAEAEAPAAE